MSQRYRTVDLSELTPEAKYRARWMKQTEDRPNQRVPDPGSDWDNFLFCAGRGWGKMLSLDTPVPVPYGWTTMGDISIGDKVFSESGSICSVTAISPVRIPNVAYAVKFSDGEVIEACSEHQWVTWTHADRKAYLRSPYEDTRQFPANWPSWRLTRKRSIAPNPPGPQVRTTQDIVDTISYGKREDLNHCVPQCGPLDTHKANLPIPPYVLGVWLGDGESAGATITQHEPDQPFLRAEIEKYGFTCTDRSHPQNFGVLGLHCLLTASGLVRNKYIPRGYLRASVSQRLELLQGLMDTDGGVEGASTVSFSNGDLDLADDVYELVVSLGMKATRETRKASTIKGANLDSNRVSFTPTMQIFRLPRKASRISFSCSQQLKRWHRMIVSVERIDPKPMRCITVDSPNSMYLAGTGMVPTHNTRVGAEDIAFYGMNNPGSRIAIVAPTYAAARNTNVEGESGLLYCLPDSMVGKGWNRSLGELKLTNGTIYSIYTAEKPDALRGPQHHRAWVDELASFGNNGGDPQYIWDMLKMGLRLGKHPQVVITTTPLPLDIIRNIMKDPRTHTVTGSTFENSKNLPEVTLRELRAKYEGTRLGEQELYAKILDDVPGALWRREWIDKNRLSTSETPDEVAKRCVRVVVAIDPATTSTKDSDLTGIVAAGIDEKGHGYILADESCKVSPKEWATKAVMMLERFRGDRIIGEANNGGDMIGEVIHSIDDTIPYKKVNASRGKIVRAEPIASLYEQNRISHVGKYEMLENELCMFTPENVLKNSPNRADAMVWALSYLYDGAASYGALEYLKSEHAGEMVRAGGATNVEDALQKIQTSGMIKPVLPDNAKECPKCGSKAICRIANQMRCNQCANTWGDPLVHDFMVKQPRNAYLAGTFKA